jgi:hypothetical protein
MRVVIIAMTALLCVGCAQQDRQAAPVSSDVGSAGAAPSSVAEPQGAAGEGYASRAPAEQAQTDGPAMTIPSKSTTMCVQNLSSVTPVVTFTKYQEQLGEGPLKYRATACATGYGTSTGDVRGQVAQPAPNDSLFFTAERPHLLWDKPFGALWQETDAQNKPPARCIGPVGYSVGDLRTWDDGLLQYVIAREPDVVGKMFRMTIRDSAKPSADGKPVKCPA